VSAFFSCCLHCPSQLWGSAASIVFALLPLDPSRARAVWAKTVFLTVGIVGVLVTGTELLLALHWIVPSRDAARTIHQGKVSLCGFMVGLILALILSRQLLGTKRDSQQTDA